MNNKTQKTKKICWACQRALVGESKLGLCPDCINKYGTPVAVFGALGLGFLGKKALKHSGKAVKVASNIVKRVK